MYEALDDLDKQILDLVKMRRWLSQRIKDDRAASRLPRTDIGHERDVVATYVKELGAHGMVLATAVLSVH